MYFLLRKGNYDSTGDSKRKIELINNLIQVGIFFENTKHALIHPDPLPKMWWRASLALDAKGIICIV